MPSRLPVKLWVIARPVYGGRNAFAPLLSAIEDNLGVEYKVTIIEGDPLPFARRASEAGYKPVVLYGVSSPSYLDLRGEIARVSKRYHVIVGGPHAEGAYWHLLRDGAWAVVVGDGEEAITPLLEAAALGDPPSSTPNTAYRDEDGFHVTRQVYARLDDYKPHNSTHGLYPPIEIMRGCLYKCKYCQVPWLFKAKVRYRSIAKVREAVRDYVAAGKRRIRFIAPIGFAYGSAIPGKPDPIMVRGLLEAVREAGGTPFLGSFPSETRPEYVTPEVLEAVRELAGNRKISLGLQSGSNRLLERVGRGHTVEEALEAVDLILEYGFTPVVDILFSLPGEEEEDVKETVRVMEELAGKGARLRLHTFIPLPGTPFARSRPHPVHRLYRRTVLRLLGRGVLEGYWEWQEEIAPAVYCLTALDPAPTPTPRPLPGARQYCRSYLKQKYYRTAALHLT
ncbi:MAG: TIGR04013 family B12-binding domain/radical SAM domain-containing protein [Desulfurococcales archaeon]|nr:TIGR04013 family B12-binding domain/radical SAM domain-containing protein [Desulfurococcales archaeon]